MRAKIFLALIITITIMSCNSNIKKSDLSKMNLITEKYWKLKTLEGKNITFTRNQKREIYITLKQNENKVTGFAGCNNFFGEYSLEEGDGIKFKKIATTRKFCPDIVVNESKFLKTLELADNYTIKNNLLTLYDSMKAPLAIFEVVYMK